jgi:hypothetical protein
MIHPVSFGSLVYAIFGEISSGNKLKARRDFLMTHLLFLGVRCGSLYALRSVPLLPP